MPLLKKSVTCSSCGARTPAGERRCRICTKTLDHHDHPDDAAFREDLYRKPVSSGRVRASGATKWALAMLLLTGGLFGLNWFVLRQGPAWLHGDPPWYRGKDWKTVTALEKLVRFRLPGTPVITGNATGDSTASAAVTVDREWRAVLDASTTTPDSIAAGERARHAQVVVQTTPTSAVPPRDRVPGLVRAAWPGVALSELRVTEVQDPGQGDQVELVGRFSGRPVQGSNGTVRARLIRFGGQDVVAVVFVQAGDDPELQAELLAHLDLAGPTGGPASG